MNIEEGLGDFMMNETQNDELGRVLE